MFCTSCGKEIDDNARFCTSCGASMEKASEQSLPETEDNVEAAAVDGVEGSEGASAADDEATTMFPAVAAGVDEEGIESTEEGTSGESVEAADDEATTMFPAVASASDGVSAETAETAEEDAGEEGADEKTEDAGEPDGTDDSLSESADDGATKIITVVEAESVEEKADDDEDATVESADVEDAAVGSADDGATAIMDSITADDGATAQIDKTELPAEAALAIDNLYKEPSPSDSGSIPSSAPAPAMAQPQQVVVVPTTPTYVQSGTQRVYAQGSPAPKKSNNGLIIGGSIAAVVLAVVIGIGVCFFNGVFDDKTSITMEYGAQEFLKVGGEPKIVPEGPDGKKLTDYEVRAISLEGINTAANDDFIGSVTYLESAIDVSGSGGFSMSDFAGLESGSYFLEIYDKVTGKYIFIPKILYDITIRGGVNELIDYVIPVEDEDDVIATSGGDAPYVGTEPVQTIEDIRDKQVEDSTLVDISSLDESPTMVVAAPGKVQPYAAFYEQLKKSIAEHGEPEVARWSQGNAPLGAGVCFAELIDFDKDGTEELLIAYNDAPDPQKRADEQYFIEAYVEKGGHAELVYEGSATTGGDPTIYFTISDIDGVKYLDDLESGADIEPSAHYYTLKDGKFVAEHEYSVTINNGNTTYTLDGKDMGPLDEHQEWLTDLGMTEELVTLTMSEKDVTENVAHVNELLAELDELSQGKATSADTDAIYRAKYDELVAKYGAGKVEDAGKATNYLSGVGYVDLIDFDGDGQDELFVIYSTAQYKYTAEVFQADDGSAKSLWSGALLQGGDFGAIFDYCVNGGKTYLLPEEFGTVGDNSVIVINMLELNGSTFKSIHEMKMFNAGEGTFDYSIDGKEMGYEQYNTESNAIYGTLHTIQMAGGNVSDTLAVTTSTVQELG